MEQLNKIEELGLCNKYYQICKDHPIRIGEPIEKMPARSILKKAEENIELIKLKGPGSVYSVAGLPEGLELNYIIQSRTSVETSIHLNKLEKKGLGTFAILCLEIKENTSGNKPNPPYPRPHAHTLDELIEVFIKLKKLAIEINESIK